MNASEYQEAVIEGMKLNPEEFDEIICPAFVAFTSAFYAAEESVERCVEVNNQVCRGAKPQIHHAMGFVLSVTHRFYGMYGFDCPDTTPTKDQEVMVHDDEFCLVNFLIGLYFLDIRPEKAAQLVHSYHFSKDMEKRKS